MLQRVLATKFVHLGPVKEKEQQRLREGRNGGRPLTSQKPGRSYIYPFAQGIMDSEVQRVLSAFLLPKYGHIHFIEGEYSTGRVDRSERAPCSPGWLGAGQSSLSFAMT